MLGLFFFFTAVWVVAGIILTVKAFQVSVGWGLAVLFLPFGLFIFLCKHWQEGRTPFCVALCAYVASVIIVANDPTFVNGFKKGLEAGRRSAEARRATGTLPADGPHEARDLAEGNSSAPTPSATPDRYASQRAAYAKHNAELNARFQVLNAERIALKPGGNYTTFNAKAAQYAQDVRALQAEGAALQALDYPGSVPSAPAATASKQPFRPSGVPVPVNATRTAPLPNEPPLTGTPAPLDGEASAALVRLHADVDQGDYAAFAAELKKCLADYRQTRYFPQIVAYARQTLRTHPPESLTDAVRQSAAIARAEMESATKQVQGIINQVPPVVVPPRGSTEVYHYAFHAGATKPDFNKADIVSTRERWNGDYVYMDDKPGVFYRSADCEFNPQTKFFYTDRTVPKKRLTDAENQEVVRLYRILGKDEKILETFGQRMASADRASVDLVVLNRQLASVSR